MNDIQEASLERSIKILAALGCTFAIVDSDGTLHGSPMGVLEKLGAVYAIIDSDGVKHGLISALLDKMGCQYQITTQEGLRYSSTIDNQIVPTPKPEREFQYGAIRQWVRSFVETLQVGDTASIPCGMYGSHNIQNSVTSWFVSEHGKNSCTTFQNKSTNMVDVMRIG
jgi:hypothetical protein